MIRPLADHIVVEPFDPPESTILAVVRIGREGRHTRGKIIACGPKAQDCKPGDIIHFTDTFKFPIIMDHGLKRLILQEADIAGIEEDGMFHVGESCTKLYAQDGGMLDSDTPMLLQQRNKAA